MKSSERGGVTAEFAVLFPSVVLVIVACISISSAQLSLVGSAQKLSTAARAVELGKTNAEVVALGRQLGMRLRLELRGQLVCVENLAQVRVLGLGLFSSNQQQCALPPGV